MSPSIFPQTLKVSTSLNKGKIEFCENIKMGTEK